MQEDKSQEIQEEQSFKDYDVFSLLNIQTAGLGNVFSEKCIAGIADAVQKDIREREREMIVKHLDFHGKEEMRRYLKKEDDKQSPNFFSERLWVEYMHLRDTFSHVIDRNIGILKLEASILLFKDITVCTEFIKAAGDVFEPFYRLKPTKNIEAYIQSNKQMLPETDKIYYILKNSGVLEDVLDETPEL